MGDKVVVWNCNILLSSNAFNCGCHQRFIQRTYTSVQHNQMSHNIEQIASVARIFNILDRIKRLLTIQLEILNDAPILDSIQNF